MNHNNIRRSDAGPWIPLRHLGAGHCGSVWADADVPIKLGGITVKLHTAGIAYKRDDGRKGRSLKNDYDMHELLLATHHTTPRSVHQFIIPSCYGYIPAELAGKFPEYYGLGMNFSTLFPEGYETRNLLRTERIPPLPEAVRKSLILKYCAAPLMREAAADPNNVDCLARAYLGKRRSGGKSPSRFFSLRNFQLHLDQMEELDLPLHEYSQRMANALAFMYWGAKVDADDVEFVLAPWEHMHRTPLEIRSPVLGSHCLWVLDFDCVKPMTMDAAGLEQAARAFWRNDPYYPRPGSERDNGLWEHFKKEFLMASAGIIGPDDVQRQELPGLLIEKIEAIAHEKARMIDDLTSAQAELSL
jgi:hypothetical protein